LEIRILTQTENPLLRRREVTVEVDQGKSGTPDHTAVRKAIASRLNANPETVYIVKMQTLTGMHRTICNVDVYESPDIAKTVLPRYVVERNFPSDKKVEKKETPKPGARAETSKPKAEEKGKPKPGK